MRRAECLQEVRKMRFEEDVQRLAGRQAYAGGGGAHSG